VYIFVVTINYIRVAPTFIQMQGLRMYSSPVSSKFYSMLDMSCFRFPNSFYMRSKYRNGDFILNFNNIFCCAKTQ